MQQLLDLIPSAATIALVVIVLWVVNRGLQRRASAVSGHQFRDQLIMIGLTAVSILIIILVVPIGDTMRGQVLSLIGILLSAAIALSSTTVLSNAMAGVMLRAVKNFRIGDFVRAGEHFGRVTERGLFHTEIQTEHRELTTLPNLFLVTHPVTTMRSSGTIVSATVSIGYDVPRRRVEELLIDAAGRADLSDPFVHVKQLGDFSVSYRIAGMLTEVKQVLTARSRLQKRVLDALHEGGVEIVSPNFMNTRALDPEGVVIPRRASVRVEEEDEATPEELLFDKAEEAESIETLRKTCAELGEQIAATEKILGDAEPGPVRDKAERALSVLRARKERLEKVILDRNPSEDG